MASAEQLIQRNIEFVRNQAQGICAYAQSIAFSKGVTSLRVRKADMISPSASNLVVQNILNYLETKEGFQVTDVDLSDGATLDWSQADLSQPDRWSTRCRIAYDQCVQMPSIQNQLEKAADQGLVTDVHICIPTGSTQAAAQAELQALGLAPVWSPDTSEFIVDLTLLHTFDPSVFA